MLEERRPPPGDAEDEPRGKRHDRVVGQVQVLEAQEVIRQPAEHERSGDRQRPGHPQLAAQHRQRRPRHERKPRHVEQVVHERDVRRERTRGAVEGQEQDFGMGEVEDRRAKRGAERGVHGHPPGLHHGLDHPEVGETVGGVGVHQRIACPVLQGAEHQRYARQTQQTGHDRRDEGAAYAFEPLQAAHVSIRSAMRGDAGGRCA